MIVLERGSWLTLVFTLRGSVLRKIWPRIFVTFLLAAAVTFAHDFHGYFETSLTVVPFSLVGIAVSIFLGFRNNTSYDRFWEGRKLWGSLVNTSRTMARQALTLIAAADPKERGEVSALQKWAVLHTIGYVHAFRGHLREELNLDELKPFLDADLLESLPGESNRPVAILQRMGERYREAYDRGWVHAMHLPVLEESLTAFTNIQGGCERIRSTPIPASYSILLHRIVAVYCVALPFGIVDRVQFFTPFVVLMIAFAFFGLDAVGDEIEDPFQKDDNDLPLGAISTMIETNLKQRIGRTDLPDPVMPVDRILN